MTNKAAIPCFIKKKKASTIAMNPWDLMNNIPPKSKHHVEVWDRSSSSYYYYYYAAAAADAAAAAIITTINYLY